MIAFTVDAYLILLVVHSVILYLVACPLYCDVDSSESSFVAETPLPAVVVDAVGALASNFPSSSFVYPADEQVDGVKVRGESSLGKRPVSRALFDDEKKRMCGGFWGDTLACCNTVMALCLAQ